MQGATARRWLRSNSRNVENDIYFTKSGIDLPDPSGLKLDWDEAVETFKAALRFKTITYDGGVQDVEAKREFVKFLRREFPRLHGDPRVSMTMLPPVDLSLLYTIQGSDPSLKPYLMVSHYDVVPVDNPDKWTHYPFDGTEDDGYIYGRGTMDLKSSLMSIVIVLENYLANPRWRPKRTIMLFSGHDEEALGSVGAQEAARVLKEKGVSLEFVLDEGAYIVRNYIAGVAEDVAMISVAEKGYLCVEIEAHGQGGHSSVPPPQNTIATLAKAVLKIQDNSMPIYFGANDVIRRMFVLLSPYLPMQSRILVNSASVFSQAFEPLVRRVPAMSAMFRTSTAVTIVHGGVKENVLPQVAKAICNHRIHPNDSVKSILEKDREAVKDLKGVKVRISEKSPLSEPSPISPYGENDKTYHMVKGAIHATFPDVLVVPSITLGATDSRYFAKLTPKNNVYRFVPILADKKHEDAARIHGVDERISTDNFLQMLQFYHCIFDLADRI